MKTARRKRSLRVPMRQRMWKSRRRSSAPPQGRSLTRWTARRTGRPPLVFQATKRTWAGKVGAECTTMGRRTSLPWMRISRSQTTAMITRMTLLETQNLSMARRGSCSTQASLGRRPFREKRNESQPCGARHAQRPRPSRTFLGRINLVTERDMTNISWAYTQAGKVLAEILGVLLLRYPRVILILSCFNH